MDTDDERQQSRVWATLYERLRECLLQFGSEDVRRTADAWVDDDNLGTRQQKIYVRNLHLIRPNVVKALQTLLIDFPDWEIVIAVSVPGPGDAWPDMGLIVRSREIIDTLQRQYFPKEFEGLAYEGSRRGTERD